MKKRVFDVKGDAHKPAEHYKVYSMWLHMHLRVGQHSNYLDCSINDDWYLYSNFKNWVLAHDVWRDLALDKDLLVVGNKMCMGLIPAASFLNGSTSLSLRVEGLVASSQGHSS